MNLSTGLGTAFDEVGIKSAIASRWPKYSSYELKRVVSGGTENAMYRLGNELVARVPLHDHAANALKREVAILRCLRLRSLNVPKIVDFDAGSKSSMPIAIYEWMQGSDYFSNPPLDPVQSAQLLASFIAELRSNEPDHGFLGKNSCHKRGIPLIEKTEITRKSVFEIADEFDREVLLGIWDDAIKAAPHDGMPSWFHGDLHAGNLITNDGVLTGVIDFGLAAVGDPAADLPPAWWLFEGEARVMFKKSLGVGEDEWRRGRGWAFHNAVIAYAYYRDKEKAELTKMSRDAIVRLIEETD